MMLAIFIISITLSIIQLSRHFKEGKSSYGGYAAINILSAWMLWPTVGVVSLCVHGLFFVISVIHTSVNK